MERWPFFRLITEMDCPLKPFWKAFGQLKYVEISNTTADVSPLLMCSWQPKSNKHAFPFETLTFTGFWWNYFLGYIPTFLDTEGIGCVPRRQIVLRKWHLDVMTCGSRGLDYATSMRCLFVTHRGRPANAMQKPQIDRKVENLKIWGLLGSRKHCSESFWGLQQHTVFPT